MVWERGKLEQESEGSTMTADNATPDTTTLLRALVALQIADRQERGTTDAVRPAEVILANAGIGLGEIASLTGRKYETVKTTVRRARAAQTSAEKTSSAKPTRKRP